MRQSPQQTNNRGRRLLAWLGCALARKDGAVAVQFAILALPLTVLAFGLIDVNRASVAKRTLQDALDAATLMAARSSATTDATIQAAGSTALAGQLSTMPDVTLQSSSFDLDGAKIVSSAVMEIEPVIANLWLQGDMEVTVESEVTRGMNSLEVALVLDNTGSMAFWLGTSSKISALKTAANSLVDSLAVAASQSTTANPIKIGVVPFSMAVNVGSTYKNASWITGTQPSAYGEDIFATSQNRFTMLDKMDMNWAGCIESRPAPYDVQDTGASSSTPATMFVPYFAPDEPDDETIVESTVKKKKYYYEFDNNYITDDESSSSNWKTRLRNHSKYDESDLVWGAGGTGSIGPNKECSLTPLLRMTTNFSTVKSKISSMTTVGNTNVAIGLMWGWHLLSPNNPFSDGKAYGTAHLSKIVILLTDGDNTNSTTDDPMNSIYSGLGYMWQKRLAKGTGNAKLDENSTDEERRDAIDAREALICANMKDKGIKIYAIGVGVSDHSKTILQACATTIDNYYDVTNASDLTAVFEHIAGDIAMMRISN